MPTDAPDYQVERYEVRGGILTLFAPGCPARTVVPKPRQYVVEIVDRIEHVGGLVLPDSADEVQTSGVIVACGDGALYPKGTRVFFAAMAPVYELSPRFLVVDSEDIIARVDPWSRERERSLVMRADVITEASSAFDIEPALRHVIIRPYSPKGQTAGGIFVERNEKHPRIWAWLLAVRYEDFIQQPALVPGSMVTFVRHSAQVIGHERDTPFAVTHIDNLNAIVKPPPVEMEWI